MHKKYTKIVMKNFEKLYNTNYNIHTHHIKITINYIFVLLCIIIYISKLSVGQ